MCGWVVRRRSSAAIPVRVSYSTPISSRPRPSTAGPRPVATSIRLALVLSPPWYTRRPLSVSSTLSQVVSRWTVMSRLPNCLVSSFAASASSCGISCGSISMIVTSEPKRLKIDANSQPMIPPPRTTRRFGTSVCARSPVESTQRLESRPSIGGRSGYEPVAMIACLKLTSSPPSTAIVFGEDVTFKQAVIATGSYPLRPPIDGLDSKRCVDSTGLLAQTEVPKRLVVLGGGIIGCEFASIFNRFGSEVTIIEMLPQLIPQEDADASKELAKQFGKRGITLHLETTCDRVDDDGSQLTVHFGEGETVDADLMLVAVGRGPFVEGLGLEEIGVELDRR